MFTQVVSKGGKAIAQSDWVLHKQNNFVLALPFQYPKVTFPMAKAA
jgi:hypothetical protein